MKVLPIRKFTYWALPIYINGIIIKILKMFFAPFTLILAGATGSGKTRWLMKLLKHHEALITPKIAKILYCYGEINDTVIELKSHGIETHNGIPDIEKIRSETKPLLLILDDLMMDAKNDFLDILFTRLSHHSNTSVIFVTQSIFGKNIRIARTNTHVIVLMRSPSAQLQARNIASQLFPRRMNYFMDAWNDATREPFSYLVINMHPEAPEYLRLSTEIFPDEVQKIYLPSE